MPRLDDSTYLEHLRADSARLRAVLTECDPAARVPACPDWDAADLVWHLAEVQWFWAQVIRERPAPPPQDAPRPSRPTSYAGLLTHLDEQSASLVAALEAADPAEPAWHWSPEQTVGVSFRRQAHEALIHRLDAEQTAGDVTALDPALAADGVAELLDIMYGGEPPAWGRFEPGDGLVRISMTDVGSDLWAQPGLFFGTDPESGKNYDSAHVLLVDDPGAEPDATISGTAADLDAWLWKRGDDSAIVRSGHEPVLTAFLAAVTPALD